MFSLHEAFEWLSAARLVGDGSVSVNAVCTDTRAIRPGSLFVALRGERFDAHDFIGQACDAGAVAVLAERPVDGLRVPALIAPDSRRAFGEIAAGWRRRFRLPVLAVTGSNGKTTVKEMLASILAVEFGAAHRLSTVGNLNNDVGVPITVLSLGPEHRAAVIELGMNRPGEIEWLASIAQPTVALVNNAQREHQEFLGSVRATALENGAALSSLPADGVAVFPGDDPHTALWHGLAGARTCITFGLSADCTVHADPAARPEGFEMHLGGQPVAVRLGIDGAHNVRNALAAAACASAIGIGAATIAAGLAAFRPYQGRLVRLAAVSGARLIDDSYNANPDSVRAAIDILAGLPAPRILVLGDMAEVGDQGEQFHREVVDYAFERGVDHLLAFGEATSRAVRERTHAGFECFGSIEALIARAQALATPPASVLVKGSRSMRMERVVAALSDRQDSGQAH